MFIDFIFINENFRYVVLEIKSNFIKSNRGFSVRSVETSDQAF